MGKIRLSFKCYLGLEYSRIIMGRSCSAVDAIALAESGGFVETVAWLRENTDKWNDEARFLPAENEKELPWPDRAVLFDQYIGGAKWLIKTIMKCMLLLHLIEYCGQNNLHEGRDWEADFESILRFRISISALSPHIKVDAREGMKRCNELWKSYLEKAAPNRIAA